MKKKSLIYKSLTQFIVCVAILLLLATPLFYWLTKSFYAEDMIDIIEAVQQRETGSDPRPRRGYPAWYRDTVCTDRYRIGRGYRTDDALHLRKVVATVR